MTADGNFESEDWEFSISDLIARYESNPNSNFEIEDLFEISVHYTEKNFTNKADTISTEMLNLFPISGLSYLSRAIFYLSIGDYDNALKFNQRASAFNEGDDLLFWNTFNLHLHFDELDEAVELYFKKSKDFEHDIDPLIIALEYCLEFNRPEMASMLFDKASEKPLQDYVLQEYALSLPRLNGTLDAIEQFKKYSDHNPSDPNGWNLLSELNFQGGFYETAIENAEFALYLSNDKEFKLLVTMHLASIYMSKDDFETGVSLLKPYEPKLAEMSAEYALSLGSGYYGIEMYDQALACFKVSLQKDTTNSETWLSMGLAYVEKDQFKEAQFCFDKSFELDNESPDAALYSALCHKWMENRPAAISALEKLISVAPDCLEAWVVLGKTNYEIGDTEKSYLCLKTAWTLHPDHAEISFHYAAICFKHDKIAEGINQLHKALQINPHDFEMMFNFAPELRKDTLITETIELYLD